MSFNRGDKVIVYGDDLLQRSREATVVYYSGLDAKRHQLYTVEFKDRSRSVVREEWLQEYIPPMMEDAKAYLEALNDLYSET